MWKILNGYKTVAGVLGVILTPIVSLGGNLGKIAADGLGALPAGAQLLEGLFGVLFAVGLAHKAVKSELK